MISYCEVENLRGLRAADASVLSLYVQVPSDAAAGFPAELAGAAGQLVREAAAQPGAVLHAADEESALTALRARAPGLAGRMVGVFACGELGLLGVVPLPADCSGHHVDRAVLAVRPHTRPLLAAVQRHPDYQIAVIDHSHAWLLAVSGEEIAGVTRKPGENEPSAGYGGWYLERSCIQQRVTQLTRHLYWDAAAVLASRARDGRAQPVVIGGEPDCVRHLLAELPQAVLANYAGSFAADPHLLTPVKARNLAAPFVAHWVRQQEQQLAADVTAAASAATSAATADAAHRLAGGRAVAAGLDECITAVNEESVGLLLTADGEMVPGFVCERCKALSRASDGCRDWGSASRPLPDLLEEMTWRTLHSGGQVVQVAGLGWVAAARLR